jgi:hypothetical protein
LAKLEQWHEKDRFVTAGYATDGVDGLVRDKTRPSRIPPLTQPVIDRVVALTNSEPPHEATHWTASGRSCRRLGQFRPAHLARPSAPAASVPVVQTVPPAFADRVRDVVSPSTSIRRPTPSSSASTKKVRSRSSTARDPACR